MNGTRDIGALVDRLSLDDKARLLAGADLWSTVALEEHGVPSVRLTDGPNGARGPALPPGFGGEPIAAFCFPCGGALGATWDPALVERVGAAIGAEARTKASRVLLAPTVNLHRSPLGGRNFESYAEDPFLAGTLAAAFVRGAQSNGVACSVKHFAGNESEKVRFLANTMMDERTLREVHLVPFEMAVRDGGALAIMTSYNRLNGRYCSGDAELLQTILRGEWGFDGFVVSDWFAVVDTVDAIRAGLDVEMPGPGRAYGPALAAAVRDGRVAEPLVDAAAARLLGVLDRIGALDDPPAEPAADGRPEHRAVAREAAAASLVLLENHDVLPLHASTVRRVALLGPLAASLRIMGGGSASLATASSPRQIADVLRERLPGVEIEIEPGVDLAIGAPTMAGSVLTAPDGHPGLEVRLHALDDLDGTRLGTLQLGDGAFVAYGAPAPGCPARYSAVAVAALCVAETAPHAISLVHTGRARVLLDGVVVLDLTAEIQPDGHEYMGHARREQQVVVDLEAGRAHELRVELWQDHELISHGFRLGLRRAPEPDILERAVAAAAQADTVIVVLGASQEHDGEGVDRASIALPAGQDELVTSVLGVAPHAIVVVNTGSVAAMPWASDAGALLHAWFGGEEMADALVDVLLGDRDPGGRLPTTVPHRLEDTPTFGNDNAEIGDVLYAERVLVGHRWYDTRRASVAYPFGAGRSYTTFAVGPPRCSRDALVPGELVELTVPVTNTGERDGSEVIQVYVSPPAGPVLRPVRELKGFAKVALAAGETGEVTIRLTARAFAHWQPHDEALDRVVGRALATLPWAAVPQGREHRGWVVRRGTYSVLVGRDSRTFDHELTVEVHDTFVADDGA